jgi:hypothetical protein
MKVIAAIVTAVAFAGTAQAAELKSQETAFVASVVFAVILVDKCTGYGIPAHLFTALSNRIGMPPQILPAVVAAYDANRGADYNQADLILEVTRTVMASRHMVFESLAESGTDQTCSQLVPRLAMGGFLVHR